MKTTPSNILLPHLQHFLKPVNATPQNTSSEFVDCLNLTLQKMRMQYVLYPGFDIIATAIAKDARTAAEDEVGEVEPE